MIKANVIAGHLNWKRILKKPNNYLKQRLGILSKTPLFKRKNHEFSILLTNDKEMKNLNYKFRKKIQQLMCCLFHFIQSTINKRSSYFCI